MNSKIITLNDKQLNELNVFFKKIGIPTTKISKEFNIEEVSSQISDIYEKTISPGQSEAVLRRVMGIPLSPKQRTQLYDLRKKIQRYEKFLNNFREWRTKYDHELKIIILGLTKEQSEYLPSALTKPFIAVERDVIGVNFLTKLIEIYDKSLIRLQIWDVTSQRRFAFLRPQFYKGAAAAILVFNKENRDSFDMVKTYYNELKESTGLKFKTKGKFRKEISLPVALIAMGNKTVVPYEEILALNKNIGTSYYELGNIEDERFQQILDGIGVALILRFQG
ncbi:MAG: hypothetical protein HWN80_12425 [Candidatus Lokiarchaeota archaeon]|nr:hypothetical protein [Candidatus Lokiarchaeota archaeon]